MKLLKVTVEGVGRFATPTTVEGFGPGVNVLSAGNEAGKSTLFKAVRAGLFERHRAAHKELKALASEGVSLPLTVTIAFEKAGDTWEISKSFLRSARSVLKKNGLEVARNDEADETVWHLLGLDATGSRSLDQAAYGLLWVSQGDSIKRPEFSDGATSVLSAAIQQEVGTLVGGERARRVLAELDDRLSADLTDSDKEKKAGPLGVARAEAAAIAEELAAATQRLKGLDANLDELARLKGELSRLTDPADQARRESDLRETLADLERQKALASAMQQAEAEERLAHQLLDMARQAQSATAERAARIDATQHQLAALKLDIDSVEAEAATATAALARLADDGRALDLRLGALDAEEHRLERLQAGVREAARRDAVQHRLAMLRDIATRIESHQATLAANAVDAAVIDDLDTLLRESETLEAQIAAVATTATVTALGATPVAVGGVPVEGSKSVAITDPTIIRIGDAATIELIPPQKTAEAARTRRLALKERLEGLLQQHGAAAPAELRARAAARRQLEADSAAFKAELTALGTDLRTLPQTIRGLTEDLGRIELAIASALQESGADALPSSADLDDQRERLRHERQAARERRAALEGQTSERNRALQAVSQRLGRLAAEESQARTMIEADLAALPADQRDATMTRLGSDVARKEAAHRAKAAALAEMMREAPTPEALERLTLRAERLRQALEQRTIEMDRLRQAIARLEGQIDSAGGDGVGEMVAALQERHALAEADLARRSHRVETLKLLRDVVSAAYAERREQLTAPLRRHLKPYLDDLFPQAEIELGEGFAVSGLRRNAPGSESFERLSGGTQEQIAVLVRLAMAALLAERGHEVPVILDDALVFCDDDRIEQMFDALNRAGRRQQVVVLTCRSRSFQSLGGRALRIAAA